METADSDSAIPGVPRGFGVPLSGLAEGSFPLYRVGNLQPGAFVAENQSHGRYNQQALGTHFQLPKGDCFLGIKERPLFSIEGDPIPHFDTRQLSHSGQLFLAVTELDQFVGIRCL